ncbi:hypothetical protein M2432_005671 [Mycobacterium sp. OTB74]|nr:hypothetical protein [Mycobacterium sp. OTB74]
MRHLRLLIALYRAFSDAAVDAGCCFNCPIVGQLRLLIALYRAFSDANDRRNCPGAQPFCGQAQSA